MKVILPIILIVLSIVLFIFGVNPFYKEVSLLRSDVSAYNSALNNSTNLQKTQDSLLDIYKQIKQSDKDRLSNFLPNSVNNIQFILEVERIANLHNMPIKDIKFDSVKKDNAPVDSNIVVSQVAADSRPYGTFPIQFTVEGKYDSFVSFLKNLELNLRLVDVKSVTFTVPDQAEKLLPGFDPDVYRYTLKVETYWLK